MKKIKLHNALTHVHNPKETKYKPDTEKKNKK